MTVPETIAPHGGKLVDLLVPERDRDKLAEEARNFPKLVVKERELSDLEMHAVGAHTPLTGFQGEADYDSILSTMHLSNGLPWT
ncbi:MAG: sulfate adenylyltransferase, partial [Actinomycetota bacterium]